MDKNPYMLLVLIVGAFAFALGGAFYFGERDGTTRSTASTPSAPIKKFRAKPGTERKNARALTSSVPSVKEETTDRPIEVWGSLDKSPPEPPRTKSQRIVDAALESADPKHAIAMISEQLAKEGEGGEGARLHAALGLVLSQIEPVDAVAVERAFSDAYRLVETDENRYSVVTQHAKSYLRLGDYDRALAIVDDVDFERAQPSQSFLELAVLKGVTLERLGNAEEAEAAFRWTMRMAESGGDVHKFEGVYRQAGLLLVRLCRAQGRARDATRIVRKINDELGGS